ncbi:MAG: hypothetical protein ACKVOP_02700 [Sphingomonadaceae bacterium]
MTSPEIDTALARIEAALARIERTTTQLAPAGASDARYRALRKRTQAALASLETVIAQAGATR